MTTKTTTPQLTESDVDAIEARQKLAERAFQPYKEISDSLSDIPALIRDWRALQAENDALRLQNERQATSIYELGQEVAERTEQRDIFNGRLESEENENAALREQLAHCHYQKEGCSYSGRVVGKEWICDNHLRATTPPAASSEPWADEGGHVWERRANVECVECPHCCFTFAAVHGDGNSNGYSCPNCNGCPDAATPSTSEVIRAAAEEIHNWIFSAPDSWPVQGEAAKTQLIAILSRLLR